MSSTDKQAIKHILKLRDLFKVQTFVETGTFKGVNAELHSKHFESVLTCEINEKYCDYAREKLKGIKNITLIRESSPEFLKRITNEGIVMFYLDAHFYNPHLPKDKRFVILNELDALKKFKNCIIIIHDFDNGLGHITYDGQPLNFDLVKDKLKRVNKNFHFYTNELASCDIKKLEEAEDMDEFDNLKYVWSKPEKTYRGILYCVPKKINVGGLKEL